MAYEYYDRYGDKRSDGTVFDSIYGDRVEGVKHFAARNQLCTVNYNGHCPLSYAMVNTSNREIIDIILTKHRKTCKFNPVFEALKWERLHLLEMILNNETAKLNYLNYCDYAGYSPLARAVLEGNKKIIDCLITARADINKFGKNGKPPLSIAVEKQDLEMIKYLFEKGGKGTVQTAFFAAIKTENLNIIKYLMKQGPQINLTVKDGCTPFINSIKTGNVAIVKYLIEKGANVEDIKDDQHQLLWKHVNEGNDEMVSLLIELGVNLEQAGPNGFSPLTEAVAQENVQIVKLLLKSGASVNKWDKNQKYPLSIAISNGFQHLTELLIDSGADIRLVQKEIEDVSMWKPDFYIYLQSRKLEFTSTETGHEEATS